MSSILILFNTSVFRYVFKNLCVFSIYHLNTSAMRYLNKELNTFNEYFHKSIWHFQIHLWWMIPSKQRLMISMSKRQSTINPRGHQFFGGRHGVRNWWDSLHRVTLAVISWCRDWHRFSTTYLASKIWHTIRNEVRTYILRIGNFLEFYDGPIIMMDIQ